MFETAFSLTLKLVQELQFREFDFALFPRTPTREQAI